MCTFHCNNLRVIFFLHTRILQLFIRTCLCVCDRVFYPMHRDIVTFFLCLLLILLRMLEQDSDCVGANVFALNLTCTIDNRTELHNDCHFYSITIHMESCSIIRLNSFFFILSMQHKRCD